MNPLVAERIASSAMTSTSAACTQPRTQRLAVHVRRQARESLCQTGSQGTVRASTATEARPQTHKPSTLRKRGEQDDNQYIRDGYSEMQLVQKQVHHAIGQRVLDRTMAEVLILLPGLDDASQWLYCQLLPSAKLHRSDKFTPFCIVAKTADWRERCSML